MEKKPGFNLKVLWGAVITYLFALSLSYVLFSFIKGKGLIYNFILFNSLGQEAPGDRLLLLVIFALSSLAAFFLSRAGKTQLMHGLSSLMLTVFAAAVYANSWLEYENVTVTAVIAIMLSAYITMFITGATRGWSGWAGRAAVPVLAAFTAVYIVNFILLAFLRHNLFLSSKYDLGWENQAVYNLTRTGIPYSSMLGAENNFGDHTSFIYYFISIFYRFWPVPEFLLVFQVIMVAAAGWIMFLLGNLVLKNKGEAAVIAAVFLLHPSVQSYMLFDFHPSVAAIPLFLAAFYLIERGDFKKFLIPYFLLYAVREDIAFLALVMAVFLTVSKKVSRKQGLWITGAGLCLCAAIFVFIKVMRAGEMDIWRFYYYVPSAPGIPLLFLLNPFFELIKVVQRVKVDFVLLFSLPLLFLFVLRAERWILLFPAMLFTVFAASTANATMGYHYATGLIVFSFYGAVLGYGEMREKGLRFFTGGAELPVYMLVFAVCWSFLYGSFFSKSYKLSCLGSGPDFRSFAEYYYNDWVGCYKDPLKLASMVDKKAVSLLKSIPDKYSVTADHNILPHVSGRRKVYKIEDRIITDIIIFFRENDYSKLKLKELLEEKYTMLAETRMISVYVIKGIER